MKKIFVLLLILPLLVACATTGTGTGKNREALNALNLARDAYNSIQNVATQMHQSGQINDETWNSKVVPADHAANDAITHGYKLFEVYVASGDANSYNEYMLATEEVFRLLALFRSFTAGAGPQSQLNPMEDVSIFLYSGFVEA